MPSVPITPMHRPAANRTASAAVGSTTPMTSTGAIRAIASSATAEAVLQATTRIFGSNRSRKAASCKANSRTVSGDLMPYGTRAESPR